MLSVKIQSKKRKEADVIAHAIEAAGKIGRICKCTFMYYDTACYYIYICLGTLPCGV